MNDPRSKRPSSSDQLDLRHQQWLESVNTEPMEAKKDNEESSPVIIKMPRFRFGKTATVLSERELEVLQLISHGKSSDEIADKLNLSKHTIVNHRKNMLCRSRCGNLPELVRVALNENLL